MNNKMKTLAVNSPYNLEYSLIPIPDIKENELLIKVRCAGICATDFSIYTGNSSFVRDGSIRYPVRFGHEWSGEVVNVGKSVKEFTAGDRVYADNGVSCGECDACKRGDYAACPNIRSVGTVNCWDGCFAEYMIMPEYHVYHLPDNVSFEQGALIEPTSIAYDAFIGTSLSEESTVAVVGTGAIGMAAVWLAKYLGAGQVIMIGRTDFKLEVAKKLGADAVINNTRQDTVKAVREMTGKRGADLMVETSGAVSALNECIYSTAKYGRVSIVSFYEKLLDGVPMDHIVLQCLNLVGAAGRFGNPQAVCKIMENNPIKLTPAVTHRLSFEQAGDFFKNMEKNKKERIKAMISFKGDTL